MTMVPLRSENFDGNTSTWNDSRRRPLLVLCDTVGNSSLPVVQKNSRHVSVRRWDAILCSAAVASVLLFFVLSFASSLWHSAAASYTSSLMPVAPVITKQVGAGDTLWGYAVRYGDPNSYILERVETIARDNHLSSDTPLVPGQTLHIAVRNPIVLAQIERQRQSRMASLPR
jgi:hypothetical protein